MLTKEELKIVDLFRKNLFKTYSIREIMKRISKNSYNWTFGAVKKLKKEGILSIEYKGNYNVCSVNLNSELAVIYLAFLDELDANARKLPRKNLQELINSIPLSYFTFIVTGSYTEGKATKKSDIDVVVIADDKTDKRVVLSALKQGELMVPEVHSYAFTKSEFLQMLLSDEMNYGKLIFKNRLILFGAQNYYLIIKEAIKHGFKG